MGLGLVIRILFVFEYNNKQISYWRQLFDILDNKLSIDLLDLNAKHGLIITKLKTIRAKTFNHLYFAIRLIGKHTNKILDTYKITKNIYNINI